MGATGIRRVVKFVY